MPSGRGVQASGAGPVSASPLYPRPATGAAKGEKIERTFATKREAQRWLTAQQAKLQRGEWIDPVLGNQTFAAVAEEWKATWLLDGLGPKTRTGYESILRKHALPAFGEARLTAIGTDAIQTYLGDLAADRAPNTVRRIYTVIRNVFSVAVARRYIAVNPCDGVRFRRIRNAAANGSGSERTIATEAEAQALADATGPRYRLLVLTAAYTGARAGELRALQRRHVDLLRGQLHIERAVKEVTHKEVAEEADAGAEVYGNLVFGPTKTYERRRVTLPPWLATAIEAHLAPILQ